MHERRTLFSSMHHEPDEFPTGGDERLLAPINPAAFSTGHPTDPVHPTDSLCVSNYSRYLVAELGLGGNVHSYDRPPDVPPLAFTPQRWDNHVAMTSPPSDRAWLPTGGSPVVSHSVTPRAFPNAEGNSLMEPTPGMNSQVTAVSTPRCSTPTGQSTHGDMSSMFSSPPELRYRPTTFSSPAVGGQHEELGFTTSWATPSKSRNMTAVFVGGSPFAARNTSPLNHLPSPAPATPYSTPVRKAQNTLSPVQHMPSPQSTPNRLQTRTPPLATAGGCGGNGAPLGGGVQRGLPGVFRKQQSLNASRVLDGSGLVHDSLSKPIAFGFSCHLLAALENVVFQWCPDGVATLVDAPSLVTAVSASSLGDCVHHYGAVGLATGLVHIFEFDARGDVVAQVVDNQLSRRITAMGIFEDTLYVADDGGILIVVNMRERLSHVGHPADSEVAAARRSPIPPRNHAVSHPIKNHAPPRIRRTSDAPLDLFMEECPSAPIPLPNRPRERIDFGSEDGSPIYAIAITEDGNHVAIGSERGLFVLHRTNPEPELLDASGPVHHLSWASSHLGLGLLVYVRGLRGSVLVIRSLSTGFLFEHNTNWEVRSLRCCRSSPECVVAHGNQLDQNGRPMMQVSEENAQDQCSDEHLVIYDLQGLRFRKTTRLTGHRGIVHCMTLDPIGDTLITASMDNSIRFWDLRPPHEGRIPRGVSPRASLLATPQRFFNTTGPLRPLLFDCPNGLGDATLSQEECEQLR